MVTPTPETVKLLGGRLCLHFANTVDYGEADEPIPETDALSVPDALGRWGRRMGLTGEQAGASPAGAAARDLRAAIYAVFAALSDGAEPPAAALGLLEAVHADAVAAAHLERRDGVFALAWPDEEPRRVLFAVAADAVALLGDADLLPRVHRCPGRNCGWLFLDTSGRRRWCSMATCGSRAKMRAMYARRRAGELS